MNRPNFSAMVQAQAEIIAQTSKITALFAPDRDGVLPELSPAAFGFAKARIDIARKALDRFEAAARGEAR